MRLQFLLPALCVQMRTETAAQRGTCSKSMQSMVTPAISRIGAVPKTGWSGPEKPGSEGCRNMIGSDHTGQAKVGGGRNLRVQSDLREESFTER